MINDSPLRGHRKTVEFHYQASGQEKQIESMAFAISSKEMKKRRVE
ncbi:hypothetical protein [Stieleria varia]|nr:hypothetical protein [Stieleria varia]